MAGPREPPLRRFSRVVSTRPDIALDSPWQARHFSCRMATAAPVSAQVAQWLKSRTAAETVKRNRMKTSFPLKSPGNLGIGLAFVDIILVPRSRPTVKRIDQLAPAKLAIGR